MTYSEEYLAEKVCLYRLFDLTGALLYIGIAANVESRVRMHVASKTWGRSIDQTRTTSEPIGIRSRAFPIEAAAIRAERPRYNREHNPARPTTSFGDEQNFTPIRSFRVADDLWAKCIEQAHANGTTVTAVVVRALESYTTTNEDGEKP